MKKFPGITIMAFLFALVSLFLAGFLAIPLSGWAQEQTIPDVKGSRDSEVLPRMPWYYIKSFKYSDSGEREFKKSASETVKITGKVHENTYSSTNKVYVPRPVDIVRNFQIMAERAGGTVVYSDEANITLKIVKDGMETWGGVKVFEGGKSYTQTLVEKGKK